MKRRMDLIGQTFGRLKPFRRAEDGSRPKGGATSRWLCQCDCGSQKIVATSALRAGVIRSCGCLARETVIARSKTHGMKADDRYTTWRGMKERCRNPRNHKWADYGGRGITICDRWRDFAAFCADMGERPAGHGIERIDNAKGYEPGNCRWATQKDQCRNKRNNVRIAHDGQEHCVAEWADRLGIRRGLIYARLRRGWPVDRALNTASGGA